MHNQCLMSRRGGTVLFALSFSPPPVDWKLKEKNGSGDKVIACAAVKKWGTFGGGKRKTYFLYITQSESQSLSCPIESQSMVGRKSIQLKVWREKHKGLFQLELIQKSCKIQY